MSSRSELSSAYSHCLQRLRPSRSSPADCQKSNLQVQVSVEGGGGGVGGGGGGGLPVVRSARDPLQLHVVSEREKATPHDQSAQRLLHIRRLEIERSERFTPNDAEGS
eukprot:scaffold7957_cov129-Ochromonas_danica.AAC.4